VAGNANVTTLSDLHPDQPKTGRVTVSGFEFVYRLNGGSPTVRRLPIKGPQALSRGDMLNLEAGEVDLAASMDGALIGVSLETKAGSDKITYVEAIIDADAVYSVLDPAIRHRGDALDLSGATGAQGVVAGENEEFVVVADSPAAEPTLIRIKYGKHGTPAATPDEGGTGAGLNAALARAVSAVFRRHLGRGPSKAEAFFRRNLVVIVMEDVMTPEEHSLVAGGKAETVRQVRSALQRTMKGDLVRAIEELTGRSVVAFMSDSQLEPDFVSEVFVLDASVLPGPAT
jgi:uncharacterized protein YbcI